MTNLDSTLNNKNITLLTKICIVKAMVFPVVMYRCEKWTIRKAEQRRRCFQTVMLKTLESSFDSKEIKPVNPKENQFWIFIGRIDLEVEAPVHWPYDMKSQLIWKQNKTKLYACNDWRQKEKRVTEDEMVGWQGTGKPGVWQYMGLQRVRVRHNLATEEQQPLIIAVWLVKDQLIEEVFMVRIYCNIHNFCRHAVGKDYTKHEHQGAWIGDHLRILPMAPSEFSKYQKFKQNIKLLIFKKLFYDSRSSKVLFPIYTWYKCLLWSFK